MIGLLMLTAGSGEPVFTDRDWKFLFGHTREEVFSARLMLRFAALWLAVVLVGLGIVLFVMPYGVWWSAGAVVFTITGIVLIVPKCLK